VTVATPKLPNWVPAHVPWSEAQIAHARFVRACVLAGKWTDGERTPEEWAKTRKLDHLGPVRNRPSDWSQFDARMWEARVIDARIGDPGDESTFDPASAGSA